VVLAVGSGWRGEARGELPMISRRPRRTVVIGEGVLVEIGGWLGLGSTSKDWGNFLGCRGEQWRLGGGCPRRPVVHRRRESGGGGDRSSGGLRQGKLECKRNEYQLLMVLSKREREIRQAHARITVAARWRPSGARGSRGARGAGQRGRAIAAGKVSVTRGEEGSRRWTAAACTAAAGGAALVVEQWEQRSRGAEGVQRKKKRGKSPRAYVEN
jgi:hypothetical protein